MSQGKATLTQRVAAEMRALMAVRRVSANVIAPKIGRSQSYVSQRLRGERPFTLDEVEEPRAPMVGRHPLE